MSALAHARADGLPFPKIVWDVDPALARPSLAVFFGGAMLVAALSAHRSAQRRAWGRLIASLAFALVALLGLLTVHSRFELRYYTLLMVASFVGGYLLLRWQIVRGGGEVRDARDFVWWGILGALLGARLGHGLFYEPQRLMQNPLWVVMIWAGGVASRGAVVGLALALWRFTRRRGVPFLDGADRFAFSAALAATLVRVGNLMNSEILGRPTDQSWGIWFVGVDHEARIYRYPTQLAEIVLGLLVFGVLLALDRRLGGERRPRGMLIASFFALYFAGRFLIEFYKEPDGVLAAGAFTTAQYLSIPGILLGGYGLLWARTRRLPAGWRSVSASS